MPLAPLIGEPFRYHWLPVALLDVSVTLPPWQNVVAAPPVLIVGVVGVGFTVTVIAADAALAHEPLVTTTA